MIEILCIAAEITAVLLILSIAIPASATKPILPHGSHDDSTVARKLLVDCEGALIALRSFVYLQTSQSVALKATGPSHSPSRSAVIHQLRDHLDTIEPLQVSSVIDAVTKLPNRRELERLLQASAEWGHWCELPAWVGLWQVDNLDQLDDQHGPMASESILRQHADFLRDRLGGLGPLVRFNHSAFAFALHGWTQESAIAFIESVRQDIPKQSLTVGDASLLTTASAAVSKLEATETLDALWERLEDGIVEAIAAGANRGRWFDAAGVNWQPMGPESFDNCQGQSAAHSTGQVAPPATSIDHAPPELTATSPSPAIEQPSPKTATQTHELSSGDHSPDAFSADDMALLFKAAQRNHGLASTAPPLPGQAALSKSVLAKPATEADPAPNAVDLENDLKALFQAAVDQKPVSSPPPSEPEPLQPNTKAEVIAS